PYFEHGFMACKEQFQVPGYPPSGEKPSFLDTATTMENAPNPFSDAPAPVGRGLPPKSDVDLDNILGEVETNVRVPPLNSKQELTLYQGTYQEMEP
ncbi:UNVERIFIED_CONTAM: hypothetical protein Sindi_0480100, partial [Sesamum indicum]